MTIQAVMPVSPAIQAPAMAAPAPAASPNGFAGLLENGIDMVNSRLTDADNSLRAFVLDDSVPVHQVTAALEQSRLALELMLQVRNRLVDGYQQIMNMQL